MFRVNSARETSPLEDDKRDRQQGQTTIYCNDINSLSLPGPPWLTAGGPGRIQSWSGHAFPVVQCPWTVGFHCHELWDRMPGVSHLLNTLEHRSMVALLLPVTVHMDLL